jgi:hypothetical protein
MKSRGAERSTPGRRRGMYCSHCGKDIAAGASFCPNCGAAVPPAPPEPGVPPATLAPSRFSHLPEYWQQVFRKFDERPNHMQTYWNWPACFFGPFWYLVKGMPLKGLLYIAIMATGIGWLFLIGYSGLYGAWDYYLKESQGKQLW